VDPAVPAVHLVVPADASYKDVHHNNLHNPLPLVHVQENGAVVDKTVQGIDVVVDDADDDNVQVGFHKVIVKSS
jgi:hypothetical protein